MAFSNPVFNPRLENDSESTTEVYYENVTTKSKNVRRGREKPEKNAIEFDDVKKGKEERIYQPLNYSRPIKVVTKPVGAPTKVIQQSASGFGPSQAQSVVTQPAAGRARGEQITSKHQVKENGGVTHLHGDKRCGMLTRQCLIFVVLLILFLLLLLALIILLIFGKIGYPLNNNQGTNHCMGSPCGNGGTCLSQEKDYACLCAKGWTGTNCTTATGTDHCIDSPCGNGGTCLSLKKDYACLCVAGWKGTDCTTRTDHCFSSPCKNDGTCLSLEKDYTCLCKAGWKGTDCNTSTNHCLGSPCENGGTCLSLEKDYFCVCAVGWKGTNCTTSTNHCLGSPCENGGTCLGLEKDYFCVCATGWKGTNCTTDECSISRECASNSFCINTVGSYVCECGPGYYKNRQNDCTAVSITASYYSCGGIKTHPSRTKGLLWSPSFPSSYPHNSNCYWSLSSQVNISLKFSHFNTESTHDHVYIYDGGSTSAPLIGQYSGSSLPPRVTSSSNQLYLRFTSDGSNNQNGFIAGYEVTQSGSLRLAGGSYRYGRVEIYYDGEWGTICDSSWDMNDANVVCRQLGYPGASFAPHGAHYGLGSGRIWLDSARCSGSENYLIQCRHNGLGTHSCSHINDASVSCQSGASSVIRLRNGGANYGRVEVYNSGKWGTICDDYIDNNINGANVICRMLGFPNALAYFSSARFGQGSGPIWLDDVRCTGSEASITQCSNRGWGTHNCGHSEDFSVYCNT